MSFSYPYVPITQRPPLSWPGEKRVAIILTMNLEVFPTPEIQAAYAGIPSRPGATRNLVAEMAMEFGPRVGFWRLLEVLDAAGIPVSSHCNSDLIAAYPAIAEAVRERGWEITAHSTNQAEPLLIHDGNPEAERQHIQRVSRTLADFFGQAPRGWVSPGAGSTEATPRLLAEEGFSWFGDWGNDDQPYRVKTEGGDLLSIPYTFDINDIIHFNRESQTTAAFIERVGDQYSTLEREGGRIMTIGVHPYLFGRPFRVPALVESLEWLQEQPGAWFCTRDDIVAVCESQLPAD